jgi:hypothetical protein
MVPPSLWERSREARVRGAWWRTVALTLTPTLSQLPRERESCTANLFR